MARVTTEPLNEELFTAFDICRLVKELPAAGGYRVSEPGTYLLGLLLMPLGGPIPWARFVCQAKA